MIFFITEEKQISNVTSFPFIGIHQAFIFKVSESEPSNLLSITASSPSDLSLIYMTQHNHGCLIKFS